MKQYSHTEIFFLEEDLCSLNAFQFSSYFVLFLLLVALSSVQNCLKCLFVSCLSGIKNYSAVLGLALRIVSEEGIYNLENLQKKDWIHCGDQNAFTYVLTQKSQTLIWTCPKRKGWIFVGITGPNHSATYVSKLSLSFISFTLNVSISSLLIISHNCMKCDILHSVSSHFTLHTSC